jgi:hypothetical protein
MDGTPCSTSNDFPSKFWVESHINEIYIEKYHLVLLESNYWKYVDIETLFPKHCGKQFNTFDPNSIDEAFQHITKGFISGGGLVQCPYEISK